MSVVYVVLNRYTSMIYGVYRDQQLAQKAADEQNDAVGYEHGRQPPYRVSTETVLTK